MALTRARVVTGPPHLCQAIEAAMAEAMNAALDVRADATAMRLRMLRDLPAHGPWDVKLMRGGQVEVEFVVQTALLLNPGARPATTVRVAIGRLAEAGALDAADAAVLSEADHLWRTIQGMLRITIGARPPETLPETSLDALLAITGDIDAEAFRARVERTAGRVRAVFNARVGAIG